MPRAVILTALDVEYCSVIRHLTDVKHEANGKNTDYKRGKFKGLHQKWEIVVSPPIGQGNVNAVEATRQAVDMCNPHVAIFIGIAGGFQAKDIKIGDVVVAEKVYNYESGKEDEEFNARPNYINSTQSLVTLAQNVGREESWLQRLYPKQIPSPKVIIKPISSGEKILANTESNSYQIIKKHYNDAVAVEKEGFGFLKAIDSDKKQIEAIVIRGISDLIDGKNDSTIESEESRQNRASCHASSFAFELLAQYPRDTQHKGKKNLERLWRLFKLNPILFSIVLGIVSLSLFWFVPLLQLAYYSHQCQIHLDGDEPEVALPNCQKATQLKSNSAQNFNNLGMAYYEAEKYDEALEAYDRAKDLDPQNIISLVGLGKSLYQLGKVDESRIFLKEATQAPTNSAKDLGFKGDALGLLENDQSAIAIYEKAIKSDPNDSELWFKNGALLEKLGNNRKASEAYQKAISLKQDNIDAWNGYGTVLIRQQKFQEAKDTLEEAIKIEPTNPAIWKNLGLALEYLGESERSQEMYQQALKLYDLKIKENSQKGYNLIQKGGVLLKLKPLREARLREARSAFQNATKVNPTSASAFSNLATAQFNLKEYDDALANIDRAIALDPTSHRFLHNKGSFLKGRSSSNREQDYQDAINAYTQALAIKPNYIPALQDRGQVYMKLDRLENAQKDFKQAIDYDDNNAKSWLFQGLLFEKTDRDEEALEAYQKALAINPDYKEAKDSLIKLQSKLSPK
jgi:tetratricopeptide (TPR) repeat protein